ncbi:hypothetical protein LZ554_004668 [Drepanopeziza brunnea f. sp. 'monogermtubi']|nr:hypothetical protein LZ554_004668 [Drepanopeziza brunnea f. sp. 'monogermtubi']
MFSGSRRSSSPRPSAQQNTPLLRALFVAEEESKVGPYTRRPSLSPGRAPRPALEAQSQTRSPTQDRGVRVGGEEKEEPLHSGTS